MVEFEVEMTYERSTKNTHRYQETSENPKIGVLYIQKWALPEKPAKIIVKVSYLLEGVWKPKNCVDYTDIFTQDTMSD